jgi:hypothetical protein
LRAFYPKTRASAVHPDLADDQTLHVAIHCISPGLIVGIKDGLALGNAKQVCISGSDNLEHMQIHILAMPEVSLFCQRMTTAR